MAAAQQDPAKVVLERIGYSPENRYTALPNASDHRRELIQQRAATLQYLSTQ